MAIVAPEPTQTLPSEVDVLVARALNALDAFADFDQERVDYVVKKASVVAAYEDQIAPANARMPMFADLEAVMRSAFYGS